MSDAKIIKATVKGMITFIPGISFLLAKKRARTRHSAANAGFCYSMWLSLLVYFKENRIDISLERIGEIGTNGSLGIGICALLTGSEEYFALENEDRFDRKNNLKLLEEIVVLLRNRTPISNEYNQMNLIISNHDFPSELIKPFYLNTNWVADIKNEIYNSCCETKKIHLIRIWGKANSLGLDFVMSRAVMEHVCYPAEVYKGIAFHLKEKAYMFHDIELHSHGITKTGNGHYSIPDGLWKIIYGKRSFYLNRWNLQEHLKYIKKNGFNIVKVSRSIINGDGYGEQVIKGATILAKKNKCFTNHKEIDLLVK